MGIHPYYDTSIYPNNNSVGNGTELRINNYRKVIELNRKQKRKQLREYEKAKRKSRRLQK